MPSSRAVLVDICELKLDPKKRHRKIDGSGRLAVIQPSPLDEVPFDIDVVNIENETSFIDVPLRNALVQLPVQPTEMNKIKRGKHKKVA